MSRGSTRRPCANCRRQLNHQSRAAGAMSICIWTWPGHSVSSSHFPVITLAAVMQPMALPVQVAHLGSLILLPRLAMRTSRTSSGRECWTIRARRHYAMLFTASSCREGFPFVSKHSHQNQVDMAAIAPNLRSLAALLHKSTCTVGANRPFIRRVHTQPDFMLIAILESVQEEQTYCFSPISLSPIGFVSDNDSQFARLCSLI